MKGRRKEFGQQGNQVLTQPFLLFAAQRGPWRALTQRGPVILSLLLIPSLEPPSSNQCLWHCLPFMAVSKPQTENSRIVESEVGKTEPVEDDSSNNIYLLVTSHLCFWYIFLHLYFTVSNWNLYSAATTPKRPPGWTLAFVRKPKPRRTVKTEVDSERQTSKKFQINILIRLVHSQPQGSLIMPAKPSKIYLI